MLKRLVELARDSATYGAGAVLEKVIGFLLIPVYTRYLVPEEYGVLAMLAIIALLFEVLAFLGMRSAVFREFSLHSDPTRRRRVVSCGLSTVLVAGSLLAVATHVWRDSIADFLLGARQHGVLVSASGVSAAFASVFTLPLMIYQADRQARLVAGLNLLKLMVTAGGTIALVVGFRLGVWGVVLAALGSNVVFAVPSTVLVVRRFGFEFDRVLWRSMMAYGTPFVPLRLQSVAIGVFTEYSVRKMVGLHEAGLYNVAGRFALPLAFVVTAVNQAWWPYKFTVFREEADPERVFSSITTYYFASLFLLWVALALWGPELLRLMTPAQYHAAAALIPLLALYRLLMGAYQMFATGIELADKPKFVWVVGTTGLVVCVAATYALVPRHQAMGAAGAAILGFLAMTVAVYFVTQRVYKIRHDWGALVSLTSAALMCVAGSYAIAGWGVAHRLAGLSVLTLGYVAAVAVVLGRSRSERDRLRAALKRLRARFWPSLR